MMLGKQPTRLLVVEDREPERLLLCEILRKEGFEAVGCGSAVEALPLIGRGGFAVAVVDLRLPDLSGNQLLELIPCVDEKIRVIIYTGAACSATSKEALGLGAFACVEKTSDRTALLQTIREACDAYAAEALPSPRVVASRPSEANHGVAIPIHNSEEFEEFASIVAHDLRSPLLTVSGYSQILGDEYRDRLDEEALGYIEHILSGAALASALIDDLLDYSRAGRSEMPLARVHLESVFRRVKMNLEAKVGEKNGQVSADPLPTVVGDETQLTQLFGNLIDNAWKFRSDGDLKIRIGCDRFENGHRFTVEDNGIGLDEKHFDKAFQLFWQLDKKRYSGTGIGLAVCRKIAQCHGGRIWLESTPGGGTTVCFTIPDRADMQETLAAEGERCDG